VPCSNQRKRGKGRKKNASLTVQLELLKKRKRSPRLGFVLSFGAALAERKKRREQKSSIRPFSTWSRRKEKERRRREFSSLYTITREEYHISLPRGGEMPGHLFLAFPRKRRGMGCIRYITCLEEEKGGDGMNAYHLKGKRGEPPNTIL